MTDLSSRTAKVIRCASIVVQARKLRHDPEQDLDESIEKLDEALRDLNTYIQGAMP